jgi:serine/threonine-protein kinase
MPILTAQERIGTVLDGKYRLDRVLGEGGMGVVYDGMHLRLERRVAVKFLHAQFSQSQDVVQRFVREAQATARLQHPNVVNVFDVDVSPDGCVYMVLEFLEGESLAQFLEKKPILERSEMLAIIGPVCDALATAHAAGIIHRDIKPDNVHLSRANNRMIPKVLDFGIAKLTDAAAGGKSATQTGSVMGTPLYMSPEQAMGKTKDIGPWSDLWSTAVMTYECLSGQPPFDIPADPTPTSVILAIATGTIIPLKQIRPELVAVSDVLSRALERNHTLRHENLSQFYDALKRACEGPQVDVARTQPGHVDPSKQMLATLLAAPTANPQPRTDGAVAITASAIAPPSNRGRMIGMGVAALLLVAGLAVLAVGMGGGASPPPNSTVAIPATAVVAPPSTTIAAPPPPTTVASVAVTPPPPTTAEVVATTAAVEADPSADHATEPRVRGRSRPAGGTSGAGSSPPATTAAGTASAGARTPPTTPPPASAAAADSHTHRAGGVSLDDF